MELQAFGHCNIFSRGDYSGNTLATTLKRIWWTTRKQNKENPPLRGESLSTVNAAATVIDGWLSFPEASFSVVSWGFPIRFTLLLLFSIGKLEDSLHLKRGSLQAGWTWEQHVSCCPCYTHLGTQRSRSVCVRFTWNYLSFWFTCRCSSAILRRSPPKGN